jgi:hypothetical protein
MNSMTMKGCSVIGGAKVKRARCGVVEARQAGPLDRRRQHHRQRAGKQPDRHLVAGSPSGRRYRPRPTAEFPQVFIPWMSTEGAQGARCQAAIVRPETTLRVGRRARGLQVGCRRVLVTGSWRVVGVGMRREE